MQLSSNLLRRLLGEAVEPVVQPEPHDRRFDNPEWSNNALFDYIKRAMPFGNAQSLADDEVYAITAYVLHLNDVLKADAVLDGPGLLKIKLPNAGNFVPDPRPDIKATLCMKDCRPPPEIHSEARKVDVTPDDPRGKKDAPKKPGLD